MSDGLGHSFFPLQPYPMVDRLLILREREATRLAIRFIASSAAVYVAAGALAYALSRLPAVADRAAEVVMPRVFWGTTLLLGLGSVCLARACRYVQVEKQRPFRLSLIAALAAGVMFVGVQVYGLMCLVRHQDPGQAQTGANAFVTVFAALHAMHFSLALLFLVWIVINALADRYDHEYFWGVTLCAWFWHALGLAWCVILAVFLIVTK
ncbi:MAG: cytochrome c oxidase subunit 3 [Planctomycetaceae bacterium]